MSRKVPNDEKVRRGTARPCRSVVQLYPDHAGRPDPDDLPPPPGMSAAAKRVWRSKIDRYRHRGQKVDGFQDALRAYCELEALLNFRVARGSATPAMWTAYKRWASEFYDLPARQPPMRRA